MRASMDGRNRSNSVPALKLYKTMPEYKLQKYEEGKKKLLDALNHVN